MPGKLNALSTLIASCLFALPTIAFANFEENIEGKVSHSLDKGVEISIASAGREDAPGTPRYHPTRVCAFGGEAIPCDNNGAHWSTTRGCYTAKAPRQILPNGHNPTPGVTVMTCAPPNGSPYSYTQNSQMPAALLPPDPESLTQKAIEAMQLKPITIGSFPKTTKTAPHAYGLVGWPAWYWAQDLTPETWGPITTIASVDGYTLKATGKVTHTTWQTGDGLAITCEKGTPWTETKNSGQKSPTCGHVYAKSGHYTLSATTHWQINWEGLGTSGARTLTLTSTAPITIAELYVVNIPSPLREN